MRACVFGRKSFAIVDLRKHCIKIDLKKCFIIVRFTRISFLKVDRYVSVGFDEIFEPFRKKTGVIKLFRRHRGRGGNGSPCILAHGVAVGAERCVRLPYPAWRCLLRPHRRGKRFFELEPQVFLNIVQKRPRTPSSPSPSVTLSVGSRVLFSLAHRHLLLTPPPRAIYRLFMCPSVTTARAREPFSRVRHVNLNSCHFWSFRFWAERGSYWSRNYVCFFF